MPLKRFHLKSSLKRFLNEGFSKNNFVQSFFKIPLKTSLPYLNGSPWGSRVAQTLIFAQTCDDKHLIWQEVDLGEWCEAGIELQIC